MENTENKGFEYNYSSSKQEEIERIRSKYTFDQDEALDRMKELDREAEKAATKQPIRLGTAGCILLALGMCATMAIGSQPWFAIGVVIGVVGIALMAVAYPLYSKNIIEERKKIAPEIQKLAEEAEK